jgi:hypothetical protein
MDKQDDQDSSLDKIKSSWNSLPEIIKLIGTLLSIAIALKTLVPAAAVGISDFNAGPETIEPGGSSILNWDVSGADNITIEPDIGVVSSNGSLSVSPNETTTYKLIATGKGSEKVALCTVTVNGESQDSLLISSFEASPNTITAGESAILNWHVSGVQNVTIEPDIGVENSTGTLKVAPTNTTTYKLKASNEEKEDEAYCTVTVEENNISSENVSSSNQSGEEKSASQGNTASQNTVSQNTASQDTASQNTASQNIASQNTASQNTASQNTASQENTTLNKVPSIGSFSISPVIIEEGESSKLIWSVSSATKVSIEPEIGTVDSTGSQSISPSKTTTYTLTATNKYGIVTATKVVIVQKSSKSSSQGSTSTSSNSSTSTSGKISSTNKTEVNKSSSSTESSENET